MEKWDGVVLDINATCASLGQALCLQLLGAHALSGCDTVLFPFGKGKISKRRQLPRRILWKQFFTALYGHPAGIFSKIRQRHRVRGENGSRINITI